MNVREYVKANEGFLRKPTKDTDGHMILGYSHDCESHDLTDQVAEIWLTEDLEWAERLVRSCVPSFDSLTPPRQTVLIDMAYNMGDQGETRGFRSFKKLFAALALEDFQDAKEQILDSVYNKKLPNRSERNAQMMGTGSFEE